MHCLRVLPFVLAIGVLAAAPGLAQTPVDPAELGIELLSVEDGPVLAPTAHARVYVTRGGIWFGWKASEPRLVHLRNTPELAAWSRDLAAEAPVFLALDASARWQHTLPVLQQLQGHPLSVIGRGEDELPVVAIEVPREPAAGNATPVRVSVWMEESEDIVYGIGHRELVSEESFLDAMACVYELMPDAAVVLAAGANVQTGTAAAWLRRVVLTGFRHVRFELAEPRASGSSERNEPAIRLDADPRVEDSIRAGLRWLAKHQDPDGAWAPESVAVRCTDATCTSQGRADNRTGVTALAILAFLGGGCTPQGEHVVDGISYGDAVERGLDWLASHQEANGQICEQPCAKEIYNHALATLALCEAVGAGAPGRLLEPARRAVDWLVRAQNPSAGWRYSARSGESDMSVTGWCILALKSAQVAGIAVPEAAPAAALAYVKAMTNSSGLVGYLKVEDAGTKVVIVGMNENYDQHPSCTAIGMVARLLLGSDRQDAALAQGAAHVCADLPRWSTDLRSNDFYYWFWGSLALFQLDGDGGAGAPRWWNKWSGPVVEATVDHQDGGSVCAAGSWAPNDRWGAEGGRVYATAMNLLTLEVISRLETALPLKRK